VLAQLESARTNAKEEQATQDKQKEACKAAQEEAEGPKAKRRRAEEKSTASEEEDQAWNSYREDMELQIGKGPPSIEETTAMAQALVDKLVSLWQAAKAKATEGTGAAEPGGGANGSQAMETDSGEQQTPAGSTQTPVVVGVAASNVPTAGGGELSDEARAVQQLRASTIC